MSLGADVFMDVSDDARNELEVSLIHSFFAYSFNCAQWNVIRSS